ncbi:MAG: methyltransferase domain-containing protein [Thermoleophilia bacterium]|nr:methyltransferase domain-containing protein [Thermoleophilia bacterium]
MATTAPAPPARSPFHSLAGGWPAARRAHLGSVRAGGAAMTRRMLEGARVGAGTRVVDLGPGYGATAEALRDVNLHAYTGICLTDRQAQAVRRRAAGPDRTGVVAAPDATGLPAASAGAVIGEGVLSGVSDPTKVAILAEAARLVRPGGAVAFHELVVPDDPWEGRSAPLLDELRTVGLRPLDETRWRAALRDAGLEPVGVLLGALDVPGLGDLARDADLANAFPAAPPLLCPGRASRVLRRAGFLLETHADRLAAAVVVGRRPVLARG